MVQAILPNARSTPVSRSEEPAAATFGALVTVRRATILLLCAGIPLLAWALLPMPSDGASPSAKLDRLQRQIEAKQGQIGAKKGTERVLTTQISSSTARIDALQRRQSAVEADLSASQRAARGRPRSTCAPSARGSSACAPG